MTEATTESVESAPAPKFVPGDRVIFNGTQVAVVKVYDEPSGQLVLEQEIGGSVNTIYGHIRAYRLEKLVQPAVTEGFEPLPTPETHTPVVSLPGADSNDEFQTAG